MKKLVVYFSFTAGNTKRIAERIAARIGADILELETVKPYTGTYNQVVDQGLAEVKKGFMPPLKPFAHDPAEYDEIIIGTPTWWYEMAPAVKSFLHDTDFSGKQVALFQTNAGWPGKCLEHMKEETAPAKLLGTGLFTFSSSDEDRDKMLSSDADIDAFIQKL